MLQTSALLLKDKSFDGVLFINRDKSLEPKDKNATSSCGIRCFRSWW